VLWQNIQREGVVYKKRQEEDDDDEALKADTIDEDASNRGGSARKEKLRIKPDTKRDQTGPILTAASMSLIKFIGEYLQIMQVSYVFFALTPPPVKSPYSIAGFKIPQLSGLQRRFRII
jgi:hypothetical protein